MPSSKTVVKAYGIKALTAQHPDVKRLKREDAPSIHGNKVWGSSFAIMDYLKKNPIPKNKKVLDVGCGWGQAGVFMAKEFNAKVTGMDADPAVEPFFQLHADINNVKVKFEPRYFQKITAKDFTGVHTVIGGDICFWDELTKPLYNMVRRALKAGVKQIIIGDPGRQPFTDLVAMCEDKFENVEHFDHRISKPKPSTKELLVITQ